MWGTGVRVSITLSPVTVPSYPVMDTWANLGGSGKFNYVIYIVIYSSFVGVVNLLSRCHVDRDSS